MDEEVRPLSSNKIAVGIAFAAGAGGVLTAIILRLMDDSPDPNPHRAGPLMLLGGSVFVWVAIALAFGMPLALKRLRDPRLRYRDWAATGALGGLLAAILINLLALAATLFDGRPGDSSPLTFVLGVFVISALAGTATGAFARLIALDLHNRSA